MIAIQNAKVVTENGILFDGAVLVDGGRILKAGRRTEIEIPADAECIDAAGLYVGPGFVDIHVHGGGGTMFHENPEKTAAHFLAHGETTVLPAMYYTLSKEEFKAAIKVIKEAMQSGRVPNVAGFYMEGPYMNPDYGCNAHLNQWKGEIREEDYREIVHLAGDLAYVWAVAPEREGIDPFMRYAKSVNPDTLFAVGHSRATPKEIEKVKKYGVRLMTHCMNATGRVNESGGVRGAGPDEYCMLDSDMYAEMICDSQAIHVKPELQRVILKAKGTEKVILISDSFVGDGQPPEKYRHATDLSFDSRGGIAGSKLTLDIACRNIMTHTNCGIAQAFLMASTNPARAVGLDGEVGSLEAGKKANLVFTDDTFRVHRVMLDGSFVK